MELQERLDEAAREHGVVGASIAVLDAGEIDVAWTGIADVATGVRVDEHTLFGIWSLVKPMTTMAVLKLADDGLLSLDDAVSDIVPELGGAPDGDGLAISHLLDCTSGLAGMHFPPTGDGPDALARVLETLPDLPRTHAPGAQWAYSNLGFVVAGIIVERLTGQSFEDVLRERVFEPSGMTESFGVPDLVGREAAANHACTPDGVTSMGYWRPRCSVAAGGAIESTAADLCGFAREVMGPEWALMRTPRVDVPGAHPEAWGLGLASFGWGAGVVGWDGLGPGARAYLRIVPDLGGAVALVCNSDNGRALYRTLLRDVMAERWGTVMAPERPAARLEGAEAEAAVAAVRPGTYLCGTTAATIDTAGGELSITAPLTGGSPERVLPVAEGLFVFEREIEYPVVAVTGDVATINVFGWRRSG